MCQCVIFIVTLAESCAVLMNMGRIPWTSKDSECDILASLLSAVIPRSKVLECKTGYLICKDESEIHDVASADEKENRCLTLFDITPAPGDILSCLLSGTGKFNIMPEKAGRH